MLGGAQGKGPQEEVNTGLLLLVPLRVDYYKDRGWPLSYSLVLSQPLSHKQTDHKKKRREVPMTSQHLI